MDPFVGSGSTTAAAVKLGRKYLGIDINPEYVALAHHRTSDLKIQLPIIAENSANYNEDQS